MSKIQILSIENNEKYEIHKKIKKQNNKAKKLNQEGIEKQNIIIDKRVKKPKKN